MTDSWRDVCVYSDGTCGAVGHFNGLSVFNLGEGDQTVVLGNGAVDSAAARFGQNGELWWVRSGGGGMDDFGFGAAAHADGTLGACGTYRDQGTWNVGLPTQTSLFSIATSNGWLGRYDPDGSF